MVIIYILESKKQISGICLDDFKHSSPRVSAPWSLLHRCCRRTPRHWESTSFNPRKERYLAIGARVVHSHTWREFGQNMKHRWCLAFKLCDMWATWTIYNYLSYIPESSKGLKFEPQKTHQKHTVWGWKLTPSIWLPKCCLVWCVVWTIQRGYVDSKEKISTLSETNIAPENEWLEY